MTSQDLKFPNLEGVLRQYGSQLISIYRQKLLQNNADDTGTLGNTLNYIVEDQDGIYEADYINCTLWRGIAKSICDYCKKGDTIAVRGKLESNRYEKDGKMVYSTDVIAEKISFISSKKEEIKKEIE